MNEVMGNGMTLMATGMAVVFIFLTLMVGVMKLMALFFAHFGSRFADQPAESHIKTLATDDSMEIAVAMAAIELYNRDN